MGPFFDCALSYTGGGRLVDEDHPCAVRLLGTVYDGAGHGIPDALVELWQPDPQGNIVRQAGSLRRDGSAFTGWGRSATDANGQYSFTTLPPGSATAGRSPFFAITVFARGLLNRLFTRAYLPDADLDADDRLSGLTAAQRATLRCLDESLSGRAGYRFDIRVQGGRTQIETVFLSYGGDRR